MEGAGARRWVRLALRFSLTLQAFLLAVATVQAVQLLDVLSSLSAIAQTPIPAPSWLLLLALVVLPAAAVVVCAGLVWRAGIPRRLRVVLVLAELLIAVMGLQAANADLLGAGWLLLAFLCLGLVVIEPLLAAPAEPAAATNP